MEDGMHLPCGGKVEFVGGRGKDFFYLEGSFSFWGKFSRFIMEVEVFVIEPDLISDFPGGKVGVYPVFHQEGSFFVGGNGFFLCFEEKMKVFF